MKLLNTSTLKIHEFVGDKIPPYVILSHRWEEEEVTFRDLQDGRGSLMQGWGKITGCCKQAIEDGFEYAVSTIFLYDRLVLGVFSLSDTEVVGRLVLHR
jgi:hypothetical protein